MNKLWFALLFLAGGISQEIRNPVNCQCIPARQPQLPRPHRRQSSASTADEKT
ncbi:hypothetical protein [Variovorax sp. Varisp62]|uniref:hypothetical protein n=1 Tax=Variovorax sp. Varisp62 TaxID=3243049 RepID=UPI0039B3B661